MASPQLFRHEDFTSPRIHQAGRSAIKMADYFNLTGIRAINGIKALRVKRFRQTMVPVSCIPTT
jgi:hypothetical protein